MKRITIFLVFIAFMIFMTACQPTPAQEIVVNQNSNILEKATLTEAPTQAYEAPSVYENDFQQNALTVDFSAEVNVPQADQYPVARVTDAEFSQEQVDKMAAYLMQGKPLIKHQKGKDELEDAYVQYKAFMEEVKQNPEKYEMSIEEYEKNMERLEEEFKNAPETAEDQIVDSTLKQGENRIAYLNVTSDLGKKEPASLSIINRLGQGSVSFQNGTKYSDVSIEYPELITKDPDGLTMSREEALEIADKAIEGIGAKGMMLSHMTVGAVSKNGEYDTLEDYTQQCYIFYYTPSLNGIVTTYYAQGAAVTEDSQFNQIHGYENIMICVDDSGLVSLNWLNYRTITENQADNVALIPFEKIMENAKQQFANAYSWNEGHENCRIKIDKINLGYMLVAQKNNDEYNLMIPVWDFYGEMAYDGGEYTNQGCYSLLTINAIDGSNIDRNLGY